MNQYIAILITSSFITLSGCALFETNDDFNIPTIEQPPQSFDAKSTKNAARIPINTKINASSPTSKNDQAAQSNNTPRVQEDRDLGGSVDQIKVNNKNLPSYYIYPTQQNWNVNRIPDRSISTPNWQINW